MNAAYAKRAEHVPRPEIELLLACARTRISEESASRIGRLVGLITDWHDLIRTGNFHGVLPLLYTSLSHVCAQAVPSSPMAELRARYHSNSARNLFLAARLLKILQFLAANGISAVAFKGPTLAVMAYGNLALREFCDLDVLVKEKDFPKAKELFLNHGFAPWRELTPLEEAEHYRSNHAYTLVRSEDGLRLDLHWRIAQEHYAFGLDIETLWNRMTRLSFLGRDALSMSAEDLLMVLCVHGSKHCWERLTWICDVAEMVRANPELGWEGILDRSGALHISRAVLLGLNLAKSLLDAPVPENISRVIQNDRGVRRISSLVQNRLFVGSRKVGPLESAMLFFMTRERLQNRLPHLRYSFHRVFNPNERDLALVSLPGFARILYYPLRIMRLTTARTRGLITRLLSRTS